jgi:hypothetical protein
MKKILIVCLIHPKEIKISLLMSKFWECTVFFQVFVFIAKYSKQMLDQVLRLFQNSSDVILVVNKMKTVLVNVNIVITHSIERSKAVKIYPRGIEFHMTEEKASTYLKMSLSIVQCSKPIIYMATLPRMTKFLSSLSKYLKY